MSERWLLRRVLSIFLHGLLSGKRAFVGALVVVFVATSFGGCASTPDSEQSAEERSEQEVEKRYREQQRRQERARAADRKARQKQAKLSRRKPKRAEFKAFVPEQVLNEVWRLRVGGKRRCDQMQAPTIVGDVIYAAAKSGLIVSVNRLDGTKLWVKRFRRELIGDLSAGAGLLTVADREGSLMALDIESGKQLWQAEIGGELLAAAAHAEDYVATLDANGFLSLFRAADGSQIWRYGSNPPFLTLRGDASPVFAAETLYAGFANGRLAVLELESGVLRWSRQLAAPAGDSELERLVDIDGRPLVTRGAIYAAAYNGSISAFEPTGGLPLWSAEFSSYLPLVAGLGNVYAIGARGEVAAFDQQSGQQRWLSEDYKHRQLSAASRVRNYLAFADLEGYVHLLRQIDGRTAARRQVDSSGICVAPLLAGKLLYVYANSGYLYAYEVAPPEASLAAAP